MSSQELQHVVIVGGGMAGLTCARTLLEQADDNLRVTLLEANSQVGGRIYANCEFCPGHPLDLGAEYIRGTGTLLTDYLQEFQRGNLLHAPPAALKHQKEQKQKSAQLRKKQKALRKKQQREEKQKQEESRKAMQRQQSFLLRQKLAEAKQEASKRKMKQQTEDDSIVEFSAKGDDSIVVFNAANEGGANGTGTGKTSNKASTKLGSIESIPSVDDSFANDYGDEQSESESEHKSSGIKPIPEEGDDSEVVQEHVRRTSLGLSNPLRVASLRHVNAENNHSNKRNLYCRPNDEENSDEDGGVKNGGDKTYDFLHEDFDETERQEEEDRLLSKMKPVSHDHDEDDEDFADEQRDDDSDGYSSNSNTMAMEQIFISSHADGGPQEAPTSNEGKYAMYYFLEQLLPYSDEQWIQPLTLAVEQMMKFPIQDMDFSVAIHDVLIQQLQETIMSLEGDETKYSDEMENDHENRHGGGKPTRVDHLTELYNLAVASFGNTVTMTDLTQLSLPMLRKFEHFWATHHESHANYRMPPQLGMYSIVQALQMQLEMAYGDGGNEGSHKNGIKTKAEPRFELIVNAPVQEVGERKGIVAVTYLAQQKSSPTNQSGKPVVLRVDRVVVAVPPPILPRILPDLTPAKKEALEYVSFSNIVRVVCKFSKRFWPEQVQTIISADGMFPELRLRSFFVGPDQYHLVIFHLSDEYANTFIDECQFENLAEESSYTWDKGKAAQLCCEHLVKVLELGNPRASVLTVDDLHALMIDILIHDWKSHPYVEGGQLAPKVGMTTDHLEVLAEPLGRRIHFCGEATNTGACGTIQAAMETGVRAAEEVLLPPGEEAYEDEEYTEVEVEDEVIEDDKPTRQGSPGHVRQQIKRIESQSPLRAAPSPSGKTNTPGKFDPSNVAQLIQMQMSISRNLAKQEETSFSMIRAMEERQLEVSRALLDQEQASFIMIQTIEELTAKVQHYESQSLNGQPYKPYEPPYDASDNASLSSEAKWKDDKVRILEAHEKQTQKFQSLQNEWQELQHKVSEKDSLLRDQQSMIDDLTRKMKEMESKPNQSLEKDRILKEQDATAKRLKQRIKTLQSQLQDSKKEHGAAIAMVRHRDLVIKYMKQQEKKHVGGGGVSDQEHSLAGPSSANTGRIRRQKAAREEKLKGMMSRIVCSKQNIRNQKERARMHTMQTIPQPTSQPTYVPIQNTSNATPSVAVVDPMANLESSSVEQQSLPWETKNYDGVSAGDS